MKWRRTSRISCGAAAGERLRSPADDRFDARRDEFEGFVEADPAVFAVLGAADHRIDRQAHVAPPGLREVIPGDLAAAVRPRLRGIRAPGEVEILDRGFFAHFADGGGQRLFAFLDHPFREVPVVEGAQQQVHPVVAFTADDHDTG